MTGLVVTSHSDFCMGFKHAAEMLGCPNDNTCFISLTDDGMATFSDYMEEELKKMHEKYDRLIIMCDLFMGTPYNTANNLVHKNNFPDIIITGANLPMYVEIASTNTWMPDTTYEELLEKAQAAGSEGLRVVDPNAAPEETGTSEEDF